ncbi:MAG: hypothetical protein M0P71_18325 [Melioribacteraceae bacterium]|nr:hypothetical protein [Melioribacteraceae bacterium]
MSKLFEKFLKVNFGNTYFKEYQGLFGIPDFVFYSKYEDEVAVISFELKLKDWKRAAKQAFRYKSFSNIAYVVLSSKSVNSALNNIELFERYHIGLAKFDNESDFEILYKPESSKPFSDILSQKLVNSIVSNRKRSKNCEILF